MFGSIVDVADVGASRTDPNAHIPQVGTSPMTQEIPGIELLLTVLYGLLGAGLTALGVVAEYVSLQHLGTGELAVGIWMAIFGAILLYGGIYAVGYQRLATRLR